MQNISQLLQNWNLSGEVIDISDEGFSGSKIYKLIAEIKSYVLKGYPEKINKGNLLKTQEILTRIKEIGTQLVPAPYPTVNGETVIEFEGRVWDLVDFFQGEHLQDDPNHEQLSKLVETVAKIHLSTKDIKIDSNIRLGKPIKTEEIEQDFVWWDSLSIEKKEQLKSLQLHDLFSEFIGTSKDYFSKVLKSFDWRKSFDTLPKNIIHRDLTKKNTLFEGNDLTGIIDFETIRYGIKLDDIARLVVEFTDGTKDKINTVLKEYGKVNQLTELELASFNTWVILLNCGVNLWVIKYYTEDHINNGKDIEYLVKRMKKANLVYKSLYL